MLAVCSTVCLSRSHVQGYFFKAFIFFFKLSDLKENFDFSSDFTLNHLIISFKLRATSRFPFSSFLIKCILGNWNRILYWRQSYVLLEACESSELLENKLKFKESREQATHNGYILNSSLSLFSYRYSVLQLLVLEWAFRGQIPSHLYW